MGINDTITKLSKRINEVYGFTGRIRTVAVFLCAARNAKSAQEREFFTRRANAHSTKAEQVRLKAEMAAIYHKRQQAS